METRKHLKTLLVSALILTFVWIAESFKALPAGSIVGAGEVIAELLAAYFLIRFVPAPSRSLQVAKGFLVGFFGFLAFADFFYVTFFYVMSMDLKSPTAALFSTLEYCLAFIAGTIAMCAAMGRHWWKQLFSPIAILPLCISTPVAIRFLVSPWIHDFPKTGVSLFDITQGADILSSWVLVNVAILVLLSSRYLFWSLFSCGAILVVLADWALRVESLLNIAPSFGFYEYFWDCGILLCALPIILFRMPLETVPKFRFTSLVSAMRFWGLVLLFISVVFLTLSQTGNTAAIRIITLGCGTGTIILTLVSHFFADSISHFYRVLADVLNEAMRPDVRPDSDPDSRLPVELQETYQMVFDAKVKEQIDRESHHREMSVQLALTEMAQQVTHDIRSPLAALESSFDQLAPLPEDLRIMIRSSVTRIKDITNNLLSKFENRSDDGAGTKHVVSLPTVIDSIVSEKRTQYRALTQIDISRDVQSKGYGLFANVNSSDLKRVLSNLISNAVEAIDNAGRITIRIEQAGASSVAIVVRDTGKGIPADILPKLFESGATFGKPGGTGRGLYHARQIVEGWGGEVTLTSEVNVGTEVRLSLPLVAAPAWFLEALQIVSNDSVVVLDDDVTIHQVWKRRLSKYSEITVFHFSTPGEIRAFLRDYRGKGRLICLFDHELLGFQETGIKLLEAVPPDAVRVLVTSHAEEKEIQDGCIASGYKLLPKEMAASVPIEMAAPAHGAASTRTVVILEDDKTLLNQYLGVLSARHFVAQGFTNANDLLPALSTLSPSTIFVVDHNLGSGLSGTEITKKLADAGFTRIILNTGDESIDRSDAPWVSIVVHKGRSAELLAALASFEGSI